MYRYQNILNEIGTGIRYELKNISPMKINLKSLTPLTMLVVDQMSEQAIINFYYSYISLYFSIDTSPFSSYSPYPSSSYFMSSSTSSFVSPTSKRWMGKSTRDSLAKVSNTFLMIVSIYLANIFHSFSLSSSLLCYYIARIFTASFYQYILSCIWSWIDLHTWY